MLQEFQKAGKIPAPQPASHTTVTNMAPHVPGAPPVHPEVPLTNPYDPRHSAAFMYPGASHLAMQTGFQTGETSKVVATSVKETVSHIQTRWSNWKGTLEELLKDVKYVWWVLAAGVVGYLLYETYPVWSLLWDALMMLMRALRGALRVLQWLWDGFTELVAELWSGVTWVVHRITGSS